MEEHGGRSSLLFNDSESSPETAFVFRDAALAVALPRPQLNSTYHQGDMGISHLT